MPLSNTYQLSNGAIPANRGLLVRATMCKPFGDAVSISQGVARLGSKL